MGTLYLVRHGQASFGADNYDQLSPLGERQCEALGAYFRERGVRFDAALAGSLQRQAQSLAAIERGLEAGVPGSVWPALNEYDPAALVRSVHPEPLPRPDSPERVRQHFRLLREALARWMAAELEPVGMPSFAEFASGVRSVLDHVRSRHDGDVLVVSSGGPIATAVGLVLETPAATTIELNLRIRNSSVTEFAFTPRRHALVAYNAVPHLDRPDRLAWISHT